MIIAFLFFLYTALKNLRRGGQRIFVALICVAFGVMSLVAMTTLAKSIETMMVLEPYELIGGDLTLDRVGEEMFTDIEVAQLDDMLQDGQIDQYTLIDYSNSLAFKLPNSGELVFPAYALGVDQTAYPLAGALTISQPQDVTLGELLASPGDVIITRDLALEYQLEVGDTLVLTDMQLGKPLNGRVSGIASDTPNHQGSKVYYSHETAALLTAKDRIGNTVLVNASQPEALREQLETAGWRVFTALELAKMNEDTEGMIVMGLKGLGILGLLVGGVGIGNTMQVLMRRRWREIAIWKTLGFTSGQLQLLFAFEAALLGLAGSALGAGLGVALSYGLVNIFSRTTTVLVQWQFSPAEVVAGFMVGIITTVLFAVWAIVSTSEVRPLALIRNETLTASRMPVWKGIGLGLLLAVPFLTISCWILDSFKLGLVVLLATIAGLCLLGAVLWGFNWLVIRLIPLKRWSLSRISRNNLRRRGLSSPFAMVAIFYGVVSLSWGAVITQSAQNVVGALEENVDQENIAIFASAEDESVVRQVLDSASSEISFARYQTSVLRIQSVEDKDVVNTPVLVSSKEPVGFILDGEPWGSTPDGVYVQKYKGIPVGSHLEVTLSDGSVHTVRVAGTFEVAETDQFPGEKTGVLLPESLSRGIAAPDTVQAFIHVPEDQVGKTASLLGKALPQATIISLPEYLEHFIRQYQNLFVFAAAMSGLAILAGILLVANSVSLAMVERRYEIGVLKSLGYSRGQVQAILVVEYVLVAAIMCGSGLLLTWGILGIISMVGGVLGSLLTLKPLTAGMIAAFTIGLTCFTVLLITWRPASVSPVIILNDRE